MRGNRSRYGLIPLTAAMICIAVPVDAQTDDVVSFDDYELSRIDSVTLSLNDNVSNGCMPRPNAIRDAAELRLRAGGIAVESNARHRLVITAFGNGVSVSNTGVDFVGCAISLDYSVYTDVILDAEYIPPNVSSLVGYRVAAYNWNFLINYEGSQDQIRRNVEELTDTFVLSALRARDRF